MDYLDCEGFEIGSLDDVWDNYIGGFCDPVVSGDRSHRAFMYPEMYISMSSTPRTIDFPTATVSIGKIVEIPIPRSDYTVFSGVPTPIQYKVQKVTDWQPPKMELVEVKAMGQPIGQLFYYSYSTSASPQDVLVAGTLLRVGLRPQAVAGLCSRAP